MKYLRSYTGSYGESHFEDLETELAPLEFIPGMPPMDVFSSSAGKHSRLRAPSGGLGRRLSAHAAMSIRVHDRW